MCIPDKLRPNLLRYTNIVLLLLGFNVVDAAKPIVRSPSPFLNPFSLEPGLIGKNLDPALQGKMTIQSSTTAQPLGSTATSSTQAEKISSSTADEITFALEQVIISGNHAIPDGKLQAVFTPYLHHNITLAQLMQLVDSLTSLYQKAGYFLSKAFLPPQQIANGIVHVNVVEGFISRVDVQGVTGAKQALIKRFGDRIKTNKPIQLEQLERALLIMNDISGFDSKSFVSPDPDTPLGSTLTLKTEYTPVSAYYSHDNFQTLYLGPQENTFNGAFNSLLIPGGTTTVSSITADHVPRLQYYEIQHNQLLSSNGLSLTADVYYTRTHPGFILRVFEVIGYSGDANATLSYPILRSKQRNISVSWQFNYMDSHSTVLNQLLYQDWIRDFPLVLKYQDILWKGDDSVTVTLDKGFNIFGAHDNNVFHSHTDGSSDYFRVAFTATRAQYLTDNLSVYALFTAQHANRPLLSAMDFIFGGPYLGRGYDMAQFTGDQGIAGTLEGRANLPTTLPFMKDPVPFLQNLQFYGFWDVGRLQNFQVGRALISSGASAGIGIRMSAASHLNFSGFLARPLTTPNATQLVLGKSGKQFLGYFQVTAYF